MLAIIRCLEEWESELRGIPEFEVLSDHKNLEYFMTVRKLTERQIRWSLVLSRYNFKIRHIDGKDNILADALSRRDQDLPTDSQDDRVQERHMQLLKPYMLADSPSPEGLAETPRAETLALALAAPVTPEAPDQDILQN